MSALLLLCATALLATVANAQNSPALVVVRPPAYVSAVSGQTVRVTCVGFGNPAVTFTWSKSDGQTFNQLDTSSNLISISTTTMAVDGTTYYVSVLQMCNVSPAYSTQYACNATNGVSATPIAGSSATFTLSVSPATTVPPAIVVQPPASTNVNVDTIVELVCVAYGNPVPTVSWVHGDISINNDSLPNALVYSDIVSYGDVMFRKSVLQFCTITSRDSGAYTCSASNGISGKGIASSIATFNVAVLLNPSTTSTSTPTSMPRPTTSTPPTFAVVSETGYQVAVALLVILVVVLIIVLVALCIIVFAKSGMSFSSWKKEEPPSPAINEAADDDFTKVKFSELEASNPSGEYEGQYDVAN